MRALVTLSLLFAVTPAVALAQASTCVILPQPTTSTAPAEAQDRATAALSEALHARGMTVIPARDAQLRMADQPFHDCAAIECAPAVNRFLGTRFAVLVELTWLRGRPTMINVVMIGVVDGASTGGQAIIERGGDLAAAVRSALTTAWDRWDADAQGTFVIDSTPPGALVSIDGSAVGRAPIRQLVNVGVHTIAVTLDGYDSQTRDVTIDRMEEHPLHFVLTETAAAIATEPTAPPPEEQWQDRPHFANWLIGAGALALAVGLAIEPIWTAATNGTVLDHGAAGTDTVVFGPVSAAMAILSGACLIAGVVVLVIQPITERVRLEVTASGLRIGGTF